MGAIFSKSNYSRRVLLQSGLPAAMIGLLLVAGLASPESRAWTKSGSTTTSMGGGGGGGMMIGGGGVDVLNAANGPTLVVRQINKTMHDGANVKFWVFCSSGSNNCRLPGPTLQLGVGKTANFNLDVMMAPQEMPPYQGHTIHPHGLDVPQSEDGVPETGAAVLGDNYSFHVDSRYVGSHMYHCHVHTVKHLEMGMYGAFVVKAVDNLGNYVNVINQNGPAYDYEWNWVLSAVDPAYHADNAVGDSKVFADYNPKYFLINGNEGLSKTAPAETVTAATGAKVVIRVVGIHSVNGTFQVKDAGGSARSFVIYNRDGFALPSPETVTSADITPGQTMDVMLTLPTTSGSWYPQITYKSQRNGAVFTNGVVYARLDF